MRDIRKDEKYFENYISYQRTRIEKKKDKLSSCDDAGKRERISMNLLGYDIGMLVASFSYGVHEDKMSEMVDDICDVSANLDNINHETIMIVLSVAIMVQNRSEHIMSFIKKNSDEILRDKLLNCLAEYLTENKAVWTGELRFSVYKKLDEINTAKDKEALLQDYLSDWYSNRRDFAWYNTDKSDKDTYVGYWSFETAALVKIFKVKDNNLKKNQYYPSL